MGTWKQLYETPQHPYTVKLLESTPARDKRGTELHTITGRVPKATEYNDGCRFADRCPQVMDGCDDIVPTLHAVNGGEHNVACHLYNPEPPFSVQLANRKLAIQKDAKLTRNTKLVLETDEQDERTEETGMEEGKEGRVGTHPSKLPNFQTSNLLQVKDLCVHYPIQKGIFKRTVGYVYAVDDVTLDIPRGKTLALVGESGSARPPLVKRFSG